MTRHPHDEALPDMERFYPKDTCSCGHHLTQHEYDDLTKDVYCRACTCDDYDGPFLEADL